MTIVETSQAARTARIAAAYVAGNRIAPSDVPALIATVGAALDGLGQTVPTTAAAPEAKTSAQIRASKQDDYLVSFLDGRRYKSLKRHLSGRGLTPEAYRQQFGLPVDYPMVAQSYARRRSEIAKAFGLGRIDRAQAPQQQAA